MLTPPDLDLDVVRRQVIDHLDGLGFGFDGRRLVVESEADKETIRKMHRHAVAVTTAGTTGTVSGPMESLVPGSFRPLGEVRVTTENTLWVLRDGPLRYLRMPRSEAPRAGESERLADLTWHEASEMRFEVIGSQAILRVWPVAPNASTGRSRHGIESSLIEDVGGTWIFEGE